MFLNIDNQIEAGNNESMLKIVFSIVFGIAFFGLFLLLSRDTMPNSGMYSFKRVKEKLVSISKRDREEKIDYQIQLLKERMKEIDFIYHSKNRYLLLSTSMRYSSTAGKLTNLVLLNNIPAQKKLVYEIFSKDKLKLKKLEVEYKWFEKKFIADAYYSLGQYQNMLR